LGERKRKTGRKGSGDGLEEGVGTGRKRVGTGRKKEGRVGGSDRGKRTGGRGGRKDGWVCEQ